MFSTSVRFSGVTMSVLGASPNVHIVIAPLTTGRLGIPRRVALPDRRLSDVRMLVARATTTGPRPCPQAWS